MDLTVKEGTEREVLQDVREMCRDHILPRLTDLEIEIKYLRQVCWPVCQSLREKSQLHDIKNKRMFFEQSTNSIDEIKSLLNEKQKINNRLCELGIITSQSVNLLEDEFIKLFPPAPP